MPALRVVVGPVDDAAFLVPNIFAVETDAVADFEPVDPRGKVDVVRHQQRLSGCELKNESLMSRSVDVIRQNANDRSFTFDLYVACAIRKRASDRVLVGN